MYVFCDCNLGRDLRVFTVNCISERICNLLALLLTWWGDRPSLTDCWFFWSRGQLPGHECKWYSLSEGSRLALSFCLNYIQKSDDSDRNKLRDIRSGRCHSSVWIVDAQALVHGIRRAQATAKLLGVLSISHRRYDNWGFSKLVLTHFLSYSPVIRHKPILNDRELWNSM